MDAEQEALLQRIEEHLRANGDQIDALRLVIDAIATRVRTDPDWLEAMTPDTKELVRAVLKASLAVGGPEVSVTVH